MTADIPTITRHYPGEPGFAKALADAAERARRDDRKPEAFQRRPVETVTLREERYRRKMVPLRTDRGECFDSITDAAYAMYREKRCVSINAAKQRIKQAIKRGEPAYERAWRRTEPASI